MGEQGAESIHAHLMKLGRTHQTTIPNEVDRLKYIMKEHMLESFTYLLDTTSEEEKITSSADSSNSSDSDYSYSKMLHELHMNVPINTFLKMMLQTLKKKVALWNTF